MSSSERDVVKPRQMSPMDLGLGVAVAFPAPGWVSSKDLGSSSVNLVSDGTG